MSLLDRWIAAVFILVSLLLLAASVIGPWAGDDRGMLIFLAIDCAFFSLIAALFPRSNEELASTAVELAKFGLLSIAILGFIGTKGYLLAGAPKPIPEELYVTGLVIGLPTALVLPAVLRRFVTKRRNQKVGR